MWCRLVTGGESADARPIAWQRENEPSGRKPGGLPDSLYSEPGYVEYTPPAQSHQVEQRVADAFQMGLLDGESAALQKLRDQADAKIAQLAQSIEQLAAHRARIHRDAEPELVKLSLAVARRILRRELTVDPDALLGLVKAGLEKIDSSEVHRIRVHPEHALVLTRLLEGSVRPVAILGDSALPVGAVVFETSRGTLDTGLETQLKEIERGFADLYPR